MITHLYTAIPVFTGQVALFGTNTGARIPIEANSTSGGLLVYSIVVGDQTFFSVDGSDLVIESGVPVGIAIIQVGGGSCYYVKKLINQFKSIL